jgi:hypothetical protein
VRLALRRLLPDDQVNVAVTAGWAASADAQASLQGDPFADWSPATRRFPLTVAITSPASVGPQVLEELQAIAEIAMGGWDGMVQRSAEG